MWLEPRINISENFMNSLNEAIYNIEIPERSGTAARYFAVACDHHHAIIILMQNKRYASSFALLRILFEAYTRGLWLYKCANDSGVKKTTNFKGNFPNQNELVESIKNDPEIYNTLWPKSNGNKNWSIMNDLTHTGELHIQKWDRSNFIEPNYNQKEIEEVLQSADIIGAYATLAIAKLSNQALTENKVLAIIKDKNGLDSTRKV